MAHELEAWFHVGISAHDAIDLLEKHDNGAFLFRPSSSPGFLSLSYKGVKGDDTIHHIRVQVEGRNFITDGDPKRYESLAALVKARNSILTKPVYFREPVDENDVRSLVDMGFTQAEAIRALRQTGNKVEEALEVLMNGQLQDEIVAGGTKSAVAPTVKSSGSQRATFNGAPYDATLHGAYAVTEDQNIKSKNYMEDGFVFVPNLSAGTAYFAVYDGHSGREAVEYVQKMLHNNLLDCLQNGQSPDRALDIAYKKTDKELAERKILKAGCTSVSALFTRQGNQVVLHIANCGDGRAVLCRNGVAKRLSFDHKVEDPGETARIEAAGGTILWGRVQGQTMVSRSLGDHDLKKYVIPDPYYHSEVIDATCQFLILACDGIWDVLSDQEAVDAVKGMRDASQMSAALIAASLTAGTKDNLTAMIIMLK